MGYEVEWTRPAKRDFRKLHTEYQKRIKKAVDLFAEEGHGNVKRIQDEDNQYRLRVGAYRVFFSLDKEERQGPPIHTVDIMYIEKIRNRGEAYRKK